MDNMDTFTILTALAFMVTVCSSDWIDYPDNRLNVIPFSGGLLNSGVINCGCPVGTICSTSFGTVQCRRRSFSSPRAVAVTGFDTPDLWDYPIGVGSSYDRNLVASRAPVRGSSLRRNSRRCADLNPLCIANRFNRLDRCSRYTYNRGLRRCVEVDVTNTCVNTSSANRNLFRSRRSCERACIGGRLY